MGIRTLLRKFSGCLGDLYCNPFSSTKSTNVTQEQFNSTEAALQRQSTFSLCVLMNAITESAKAGKKLEIKYYVVTICDTKGMTYTDGWSLLENKSVLEQFAYIQRLQHGRLCLVGFWECSKETAERVKLTCDTWQHINLCGPME